MDTSSNLPTLKTPLSQATSPHNHPAFFYIHVFCFLLSCPVRCSTILQDPFPVPSSLKLPCPFQPEGCIQPPASLDQTVCHSSFSTVPSQGPIMVSAFSLAVGTPGLSIHIEKYQLWVRGSAPYGHLLAIGE